MEEVERCPGCGANLALVRRVHRCVAKPPVSNVTAVIPNKPDVIPNTVSNAVSNKAGTAKTATRLQTRMVQVASQKLGTQFRQERCAKVGLTHFVRGRLLTAPRSHHGDAPKQRL